MTDNSTNINFTVGKHLPVLDGLRGLAIILVLVYHFCAISTPTGLYSDKVLFLVGKIGWIGVDLFFVLSGFLITGILCKEKGKERFFKNFFAKRCLRIFPLYYANLFVFFVLTPYFSESLSIQLSGLIENQVWFWSYLANFFFASQGDFNQTPGGYFWSLAVEEQFYLFWPFLVYFLPKEKMINFCLYSFFVCIFLRNILLFSGVTTTAVYAMTFTHMDGLIVGSWLALSITDPLKFELNFRKFRFAAAFSVVVIAIIFIKNGHFNFWDLGVASIGYSALAIIFGYLLVQCVLASKKDNLFRIFDSNIMKVFGRYSYCLYLVHVPVANIIKKIDPDIGGVYLSSLITLPIGFVTSSTLCSLALSVVSWYAFEKHFLKLKKYFLT